MPMTYRLHPTLPLILARVEGELTLAHVRDYVRALRHEPRVTAEWCDLVEMAGMTSAITTVEWVAFRAWLEQYPAFPRSAIVALTDAEFGIARMYELAARRKEGGVRVFRERTEAIAWLGYTPDAVNSG